MFKCLNPSPHSNYQVTGHDRSVTDGHNKSPSEIIYTSSVHEIKHVRFWGLFTNEFLKMQEIGQ